MIGIISDIHGNYVALETVLDQLDRLGVSDIICLGDVGGYYCQINQCCDALRSRNIFTLMGNHDWYLASGNACPRSKSANVCLDFQRRAIDKDHLRWLASLPNTATIQGIRIVHGGWNDPIDEYVTPSAPYFSAVPGGALASGHTHVSRLWSAAGKIYCNPGSVGQPRDGDPRAAFATWDGQSFSLQRIEYDISDIQREMAKAGFDPYYSANLSKGTRIAGHLSNNL